MSDRELLFKSALELAGMVRDGEVSARELTELSLSETERLNPELNAFIMTDSDRALAAADAVRPGDERPFAGVPTAIKDIGAALEGYPFTCGSHLFGDFVAPFDSAVTRRIKDAGFVITGKTNLPEFGILPTTESARYGAARNPYDTSRTPGGSSGGAAAAVASGMLPLAHGSDGAGSLRIPGACCGLVGFKASRNRISAAPLLAESEMTTEGFLTRSVADAAATLDVLAGYEVGDANWAPPPLHGSFLDAAGREPRPLRIGVSLAPSIETPIDALHVEAVADTVKLLEELGHAVEEVELPVGGEAMLEMFMAKWSVGIATLADFASRVSGRELGEETVEALTLDFCRRGAESRSVEFALIDGGLKSFIRGVVATMHPYDAILCPVLNLRPPEIGWMDSSQGMSAFDRAVEFTSFTAGVNLAGLPAVSLPVAIAGDGLPLAVQLIGRPAGEEGLLSLSAQIETARPWAEWRPSFAAA